MVLLRISNEFLKTSGGNLRQGIKWETSKKIAMWDISLSSMYLDSTLKAKNLMNFFEGNYNLEKVDELI